MQNPMYKFKSWLQLSFSFGFPVVMAGSSKGKTKAKEEPDKTLFMKPSELPIYENLKDLNIFEYHGKERGVLEDGLSALRKELKSTVKITKEARDSVSNLYSTGKAHTISSIGYLREDDNIGARVGAITTGGLLGLLFAVRRGFFKKLIYTSVGAGGAATVCYPKEALGLSQDFVYNASDYATVGYNFIVGVKPQSKDDVTDIKQDVKKVPITALLRRGVDSAAATKVHEVRTPYSLDFLAQQASDITVWGFRLKHYTTEDEPSDSSKVNLKLRSASIPQDDLSHQSPSNKYEEVAKDVVEVIAAETLNKGTKNVDKVLHDVSEFAENVGKVSQTVEKVSSIVKTSTEFLEEAAHLSDKHPFIDSAAETVESISSDIGSVASEFDKASKFIDNLDQSLSKITDKLEKATEEVIEDKKVEIVNDVKDILNSKIKNELRRSLIDKALSVFSSTDKSVFDSKDELPASVENPEITTEANNYQHKNGSGPLSKSQIEAEITPKPQDDIKMEKSAHNNFNSEPSVTSSTEDHSNLSNVPIVIVPESQIVSDIKQPDYDSRLEKIEMFEDIFINAMLRMQKQENESQSKKESENAKQNSTENIVSDKVVGDLNSYCSSLTDADSSLDSNYTDKNQIDDSRDNETEKEVELHFASKGECFNPADERSSNMTNIKLSVHTAQSSSESKEENTMESRAVYDNQLHNKMQTTEANENSSNILVMKDSEMNDLHFIESSGQVFTIPDVSDIKQASKTETSEKTEGKHSEKPAKDIILKLEKSIKNKFEGDIGQSNPEDKDMYTTRS